MQVNFSPYGQPGDLGVRSKGRISLNFNNTIKFKDLCAKLFVCFLTNTLLNIPNGIIIVSPGSYPRGWTRGAGCQNLELLGFEMAPIDQGF